MAGVIAFFKEDWKQFRADEPGERFENHTDRVKRGPKAALVIQVFMGVILLAGGIVLMFIPGPAILAYAFGLAMFAGLSRKLARLLDRAEPALRRQGRRVQAWWRAKRGR